jgi:hypothetical protein
MDRYHVPKKRYMTDFHHYEDQFPARQCISSRDIEAASVSPAAADERGLPRQATWHPAHRMQRTRRRSATLPARRGGQKPITPRPRSH